MSNTNPTVIAICGHHNAGKTTFLEAIIPALNQRGYTVAVVKHTDHPLTPEPTGVDTARHREAGAVGTVLYHADQWRVFARQQKTFVPQDFIHVFPHVDFILVEGEKDGTLPKLALRRRAPDDWHPTNVLAWVEEGWRATPLAEILIAYREGEDRGGRTE